MFNTKIRLIIFFAIKDGEAVYSQQKQYQDDCGSDYELHIVKYRLHCDPYSKKQANKQTKNDSSLLLSGVDSLSCRQSVAWDHRISPTWELVRNAISQPPSRLKNQNSCGRSPAICFNKVVDCVILGLPLWLSW